MENNACKHIIIDGRFWAEAGPGRYTKALVEHLQKVDHTNRYSILLRKKGFDLYTPSSENFKKVLADFRWYSFEEQFKLPWLVNSLKPDLYYVPHFNLPILYFGKVVTAIPDIIMHKFSTHKATTLTSPKFVLKKLAYHITVLNAVIRSKKIIVPTNDVKKDFLNFYKFTKEDKYIVVPEGVDPDFVVATSKEYEKKVLEEFGIKGEYLLFVSSMYRHKNPFKLIDAFKLIIERKGFEGQLVMVGKKDYFSEKVGEYVLEKGLTDKVLLPGLKRYVTDKEVVALRRNATLVVFPSLKEGFSLTPLESQILGVPCVISDIPCHREVYEDSVEYFNPGDVEDIANKVIALISDKSRQEELIELGFQRVRLYDWQKTATVTMQVFNNTLRQL